MTNLEHFRHLLRDVEAPDAFIDWSFRWMISSALQRRVWTSIRRGTKLYPNQFIFLVAEAGIGKGMSLKPVKELLNWHKLRDPGPFDVQSIMKRLHGGQTIDEVAETIMRPEDGGEDKKNLPLFVVGPDATTYEELVHDMAASPRPVKYFVDQPDGSKKPQIYTHNSYCFASTELNNLINKDSEKICNFFLECWDCNEKYEYKTKNRGKDCVHRVCLNFAAGTTPSTMEKVFDDALLSEGISGRSIFVFAFEKRFQRLSTEDIDHSDFFSKATLLSWIRKLSTLYGEVKLSPQAAEFLKMWYEQIHPTSRVNKDPKLVYYYTRKEMHLMKCAMAIHFADSTEMVLPLSALESALQILEETERKMHLALQVGSKNPLANIARKITKYFITRGNELVPYKTLLDTFYSEARTADIDEIIKYMVSTGRMIMKKDAKSGIESYQLNPNTLAEERLETMSDAPFIEARQVVHESLDRRIRWGRNGKILLPKSLPADEIIKLRQLISLKIVTGVTGLGWE